MLLQPTSLPPQMILKSKSQSGLKGKYEAFYNDKYVLAKYQIILDKGVHSASSNNIFGTIYLEGDNRFAESNACFITAFDRNSLRVLKFLRDISAKVNLHKKLNLICELPFVPELNVTRHEFFIL